MPEYFLEPVPIYEAISPFCGLEYEFRVGEGVPSWARLEKVTGCDYLNVIGQCSSMKTNRRKFYVDASERVRMFAEDAHNAAGFFKKMAMEH